MPSIVVNKAHEQSLGEYLHENILFVPLFIYDRVRRIHVSNTEYPIKTRSIKTATPSLQIGSHA